MPDHVIAPTLLHLQMRSAHSICLYNKIIVRFTYYDLNKLIHRRW